MFPVSVDHELAGDRQIRRQTAGFDNHHYCGTSQQEQIAIHWGLSEISDVRFSPFLLHRSSFLVQVGD
jgi:hypothetical protein